MKRKQWKGYIPWILACEGVGILSALLSMEGMRRFGQTAVQPPLSPPPAVFVLAWTVLYARMGIGAARTWQTWPSGTRSWGMNLFVAQLTVNFFWSLLFFRGQAYGFAVIWLLLLLLLSGGMAVLFYRADIKAGLLQLPYLLWLGFALYLNIGVWLLNRG